MPVLPCATPQQIGAEVEVPVDITLAQHACDAAGHRTALVEFVNSQHTPRNLLLRAHRTGSTSAPEQEAGDEQLVTDWNLRPRLAVLLENFR